jgi:uncharacterized YccA/Bax inhibitor family protein
LQLSASATIMTDMSNPLLSETYFQKVARNEGQVASTTMTVSGTMLKTSWLLALLMVTLGMMWGTFWNDGHPQVERFGLWMAGGAIVGFLAVLVQTFAPRAAAITGHVYAVAEGVFLGGLTMLVQMRYPGQDLALLAGCYTAATMVGMLLLYQLGIIKATAGFNRGVMAATAGLVIGCGLLWLLSMFGIGHGLVSALYGNGTVGIIFSLVCIVLAALNLVMDFGFIEQGSARGLPKNMEWVAAVGLLVTLVWLYIEILRLLTKRK